MRMMPGIAAFSVTVATLAVVTLIETGPLRCGDGAGVDYTGLATDHTALATGADTVATVVVPIKIAAKTIGIPLEAS